MRLAITIISWAVFVVLVHQLTDTKDFETRDFPTVGYIHLKSD